MSFHRTSRFAALAALVAVVLSACGGGSSEPSAGDGRTVEIEAFDDFRYEPDEVTVEVGQEVTFVVTNEGAVPHEFLLGDEEAQMAAEGAGEHEGGHADSEYEPLMLDPGQTKEITVTFDEPGEMRFGCHVPGHFDAGMVGSVTIA